jgi:hypothetical protein
MGRRNGILALAGAMLALVPGAAQASTFVAELGSPFPTRANPFGILTRDFNSDNRPDVAVVNGIGSDNVSVYLRGSGGGFAEQPGSPFDTEPGANYAASADFDGVDGPDLAVAEFDSNKVSVLLRQPDGTFLDEDAPTISAPGGASAVAAADFNADGRPDLIIGDWRTGDVIVALRNQQQLGFTVQPSMDVGANPRQFAVADFDGDRALDVAVAAWGEAAVKLLLGNGSGGFSLEGSTTVGDQPYGIGAGDFNGDGRPDLAVSNSASNTVQVLTRTATGFAAGPPVGVPAVPRGLVVADFDSDGTPDVAVASQTANTVTILRSGTVAEPPIGLAGGPYGVATADFNADSRPDLAVSSNATGSFTSLLNTTQPAQQPPPEEPPPPQPQPPAPTPTPLPDPVAGQTLNALPRSGTVRVRLPRTNRFVELAAGRQLPVGTIVDTRAGRVTLVAAGRGGTADFFAGLFRISQTRGARPLTTLTLTERLSCPRRASAAQSRRKQTRKLWGDGRGRFRTVGRYSAATVRGTRWLTQDRCNSTLTRVRVGAVNVRDNVLRRTVIVRAGRSYTARRARRPS